MSDTSQKSHATDRPAQAMKDFAQQGADYSRKLADKSEAMADAAGKSMHESYSNAFGQAANFNVQWIEMLRDNANASFDLARQLVTAKSPTEVFEASAAHARKQMESFGQQAQQLAGLAQKASADAIKPMQDGMKNVFDKAA
ncbi:MAG: phasin family protein [Pseudorhodoplanes sp.]|uniref:phasin family protein n=1 Tax=Pseudorhodoplanes sp. TaxID=1934341 RepID=UPI003D0CF984